MNRKYWIVVGQSPSLRPYRHETPKGASAEAKRLAQQYPGTAFTVFEALEVSQANVVNTVQLKAEDVPF